MDWKKYPKRIVIMGVEFTVSYPDRIDDGNSGETVLNHRTIKISKAENGTHAMVMRTLWHEAFHALLHVSGYSEFLDNQREEALVVLLEHGVEGLFKQLGKVDGNE